MRLFVLYLLIFQFSFAQQEYKHEVYFETDKFNIPETEHNRLILFLSKVVKLDINKIKIYGFCDDRGTENYNKTLSEKRAETIKEVFSINEINSKLITNVDGKGEILLKIIDSKNVDKIRGLNRKVEITVIENEEKKQSDLTEGKEEKFNGLLAENLKKGDKFLLENILFKTGYTYLMPESKLVLNQLAQTLKQRTDFKFSIQGHVCCTENSRDAVDRRTKKRNLSLARAKYIYDYLVKKGIDKNRMNYVGMRRKFPLGGDPKFDRRVEIVITYINKGLYN